MRFAPRAGAGAVERLESRLFLAAELLGDLNNEALGSDPSLFTTIGDTTFFVADDGVHGVELFKTDRTTRGTSLVRDLLPGPGGSTPFALTPFQGQLYFIARDEEQRFRLFRTDGTAEGTVELSDTIEPTSIFLQWASTHVRTPLVAAGDNVYFFGRSDEHGFELFKSDGTPEGTGVVTELFPGANPVTPDVPRMSMAEFNGSLVFTAAAAAASDAQGLSLWKTDGDDVVRLRGSLPADGGVGGFVTVGDTLFFAGELDNAGLELWKTDGTPGGTVLVKDIDEDGSRGDSQPIYLTPLNGKLLFVADDGRHGDELWISDGTSEGTRLLKDIRPGFGGSGDRFSRGGGADFPFAVHDGVAYFVADDGTNGQELWRSDGTEGGTSMLYDHVPTPSEPDRDGLEPRGIRFVGDTLYFFSSPEFPRNELWKSDLTSQGTVRVVELDPSDGFPQRTPGPDAFVFNLGEPFITDGTAEGTGLLKDLNTDTRGWGPMEAVELDDGTVIFAADFRLYRTDGTPGGTTEIDPGTFSLYPWFARLVSAGDVAYFAGLSNAGFPGYGLWKTDGTAEGTVMVKGFPYDDPHQPAEILAIVPAGDVTFVKVKSVEGPIQLWATDGTEAGTVFIMEVVQEYEPYGKPPLPEVALDGRLFFTHDDGEHGPELWTSDGTPAGTELVNDVFPGPEGVGAMSFFVHDGTVYFQSADKRLDETSYSYGLFKVEGDGAGGLRTPLVMGAPFGVEPFRYAAIGDAIYLTTRRSTFDSLYTLARLDPATGANTLVRDFVVTPELAAYDGRLYFVDFDAEHGYEIWTTDGSPYDARLLKDIYPGDISSVYERRPVYPNDRHVPQFTVAGGKLYFVARDPVHGRHLFVTDGTAAGTGVAAVTRQREPGVEGSEPSILLGTDDDLYFASDHARFGFELFHLHADATPPAIVSAAYRLDTPGPSIAIRFSEDVERALETFDLMLTRETPGGAEEYPSGLFDLSYDRTTDTAWLRLRRPLADGGYVLAVRDGSAVTDAAFNPLAPRDVLRFTHMTGDVNGDGKVNADDYFVIDSNFLNRPESPTFAEGDFNDDDKIDAEDYFLIDSAFLGQVRPLAAVGRGGSTAAGAGIEIETASKVRRRGAGGLLAEGVPEVRAGGMRGRRVR